MTKTTTPPTRASRKPAPFVPPSPPAATAVSGVDLKTLMADGARTSDPTDGQLATVVAFANLMVERQERVNLLTQQLTEANALLNEVANNLLPEALKTAGLKDFTTASGWHIDLKDVLNANIPKAKLPEALDWLRRHGFGSLIKTTVKVMFGKGEEAKAQAVIKQLTAKGYSFSFDEGVNHQTLGAWVREQEKNDKEVPDDLLGVYRAKQAKITLVNPKE